MMKYASNHKNIDDTGETDPNWEYSVEWLTRRVVGSQRVQSS